MVRLISLLYLMSNLSFAQSTGTSIELSTGVLGGSYYDVPTNFKLDKYGAERLAPKGISFTAKLDSDKFGNIYFRTLSASRSEDKTKLGKQTLFSYESPKLFLKEKANLKLFVKGDVLHYSHKDRFIYFKVDKDNIPDLEKNLQMEDHIRVDQNQTYVGPMIGACYAKDFDYKDFDFSGFAELSLMPVAFMHYDNKLAADNQSTLTAADVNHNGNAMASGGEISVEGIAKYKGRYYLKAKISQTMVIGFSADKDKPSIQNRVGHYELGYLITQNLSVNINVENNELVIMNKDRHAIDVYNIVGAGVKWKIPYKKN